MTTPLIARWIPFILPGFLWGVADAEMLTIERMFATPDLSGASLRGARLSPDGGYVAYLRGGDENKAICTFMICARRRHPPSGASPGTRRSRPMRTSRRTVAT